ncbi:MAG: hypothetical protein ACD_3C00210G0001 [uncultured bacterium (gcode 4)]|uniref:Fibrobacter succinogenes major paralogous domain-containing protein n=1 Tax=uncultured bacterium (gcode 4) TaxID=1234023 RepID=K2F8B1_9BACT|nr:MAG: hypothetical protein ACD_3C00210G0001 [uncultured bacterium (gcode 4)]
MHKTNNNNAFTLVELIVVIVILAILATIAFLSFSSQSASARDSTRLADLSNISKWLWVFNATSGKLPMPDNHVTLSVSGTNIWYQWYAWSSVLNMIKLSDWWKDPLDAATYYTYSTNLNQNKFQLLWFLEDSNNTALSLVPFASNEARAEPSSYSWRHVFTKWDQLGIILTAATLLPIQSNTSLTWFDILTTSSGNHVAYLNNKILLQWTWSSVSWIAWYYTVASSSSRYPGCDTGDIKLANWYVWAACNVWAINWNQPNGVQAQSPNASVTVPSNRAQNIQWNYYQWWRNKDITLALTMSWPVATDTTNDYISNPAWNFDWLNVQNNDLWWWSGTTAGSWTFLTLGSPASMQWPCENWYHVPTILEWCSSMQSINPNINCTSAWQNDNSITTILKLPLAWHRENIANIIYVDQWNNWRYWTSSISWLHALKIFITSTKKIIPADLSYRGHGFSVRCMKN